MLIKIFNILGTPYIKGAIKFDLSFLDYLDLSSIDYVFFSSLDDLYLLPFLYTHSKFKAKIYATTPL